jgi:hypothetical protein
MGDPGRLGALLIGRPLVPPPEVVARWPELASVRWRRGGLPTVIPAWFFGTPRVAVTLWTYVFLGHGLEPTADLLLHELRHVQQFQAVRAFPLRYLWELARRGYRDNRFEVEARAFATARLQDTPTL